MPANKNQTDGPPADVASLATWFAEGVRGEIAELEKEGGTRKYELLSGQLIQEIAGTQGVFQFTVAEATWIPEQGSGTLQDSSVKYRATVVAQQGNHIHIELASDEPLPSAIPRGMLVIDDTALLRRLAEVLDAASAEPTNISHLAPRVFHPSPGDVGHATLPDIPSVVVVEGEHRRVLEQACGSAVTYVWGPPGTGKTYLIARLIGALAEAGERVLVTSHTHAAVDQAIYALVNPQDGPLARHPLVGAGRILRVGKPINPNVPESVQLEKVIESRAERIQADILTLNSRAKPLAERRTTCRAAIANWHKLDEFRERLESVRQKRDSSKAKEVWAEAEVAKTQGRLQSAEEDLRGAHRAWFWKRAKIQRAMRAVQDARSTLEACRSALVAAHRETKKAQNVVRTVNGAVVEQRLRCEPLAERDDLEAEESRLESVLGRIEERITRLQDRINHLEERLISEARVLFCTLTKCYTGREIEGERFGAVIADEISMALPPLVFLAAGRATIRAILVGDFLQLPPIVRSDSEISDERLRTDAFHLAGVAKDLKPVQTPVLTRLTTQRRMVPAIADAARHLAYGPDGIHDHESVLAQAAPTWLSFLPSNPLVIVDTADLYCWCGKQVGSRSRFNFYSATLAVELAAMAAAGVTEPASGTAPPIGVVTPYAAQRRLLSRMVERLHLTPWVFPGTVHTFQGAEADCIIFDSVLDEPYWSARVCTPRVIKEVRRDLNVAVTRAKHKFVFIGSSEWLNKHAKPGSGLGQLWSFLKDRADLIAAHELVEVGFAKRVVEGSPEPGAWHPGSSGSLSTHQVLDETSFFDLFAKDVASSSRSLFGLAPYFGEYRWPKVEPLLRAAIERGVEVTLVTPRPAELENVGYAGKAIENLRRIGAVVVLASGLHGKDIVIDERIHYTGSLNWSSHRGSSEIMHRIDSGPHAKQILQFIQAKYLRGAAIDEDGSPRLCPQCRGPTWVVNQRKQRTRWDFQPMKVGCANYKITKCTYLRDLDERAPFQNIPRCQADGRTKYRRVTRGRGEVWQCPKHPKECARYKAVPGDPL